jgi:hypothetical protein
MWNVPCSYNLAAASDWTGCVGGGSCNPQAINGPSSVQVAWFESWSCNNGYVHADGNLGEIDGLVFNSLSNSSYQYPLGVRVDGYANVLAYFSDTGPVSEQFHGWEEWDCDGTYSYSGPYSYVC